MRVALISDLHANADALAVLAPALREADGVVCLGDYTGYHCQVNETIELVRELDAICVLGNHDSFVLHGAPPDAPESVRWGVDYARRTLEPDNRAWLESLPRLLGISLDGTSWLLCHGSPWDPLNDYLYEDSSKLARLADFASFDAVACGQTHRPLVRGEARPRFFNPGSVGESRHAIDVACALLVDTSDFACTQLEEPYDSSGLVEQCRRHGAGHWITKFHAEPRKVF
jgi:predicted phosphodiesterase